MKCWIDSNSFELFNENSKTHKHKGIQKSNITPDNLCIIEKYATIGNLTTKIGLKNRGFFTQNHFKLNCSCTLFTKTTLLFY